MDSRPRMMARLARRQVRRWEAMLRWRRVTLQGIPLLFANSFPKSGTHLLTQVLEGFATLGPAVVSGLPAVVTYAGDTGRTRAEPEILADLRRLLPGDIAYGHLHATPAVTGALCRPGSAVYLMLRDPRDVVVSHVHYVTDMEAGHIHHRYYTEQLQSFDERLMVSILGIPGSDIEFPDIARRFQPYLGWIDRPEVLALRFEDFLQDQPGVVKKALEHAVTFGFPLAMPVGQAAEQTLRQLDPRRSPTFRKGKAGGWREAFTEQHKQVFKDVAGDLLVRLGYENDLSW
jgi:hypothetical protein